MNGITVPARSAERGERHPKVCSVNRFADSPNPFACPFTQPVIVVLQVFDHTFEIANPRPQPSSLQDQTIVPINTLTQNCLGHTNSDGFLRTCEGRWTTTHGLPWLYVLGLSQSLT